jgi:hypothetical protein
MVVEIGLRDRQRRVAAYQRSGRGIRRQAIEVRIVQDGDPLFGFLRQAFPDSAEVLARNILIAKNAAARVAVGDPFRVLRDRKAAV